MKMLKKLEHFLIKQTSFSILVVFLVAFSFFSCTTTNQIEKRTKTPPPPYVIEQNIKFKNNIENPKYIFIRLYNPNYDNPFYIANMLKFGIKTTELEGEEKSHAAINFYLDDDFYGLTAAERHGLAPESCTDVKSNKYMKECSPKTSLQITYALQVTEDEYQNAKSFVETYARNKNINFQTSQLFRMTCFSIGRKFFTQKTYQQFGTVKYPNDKVYKKKTKNPEYIENNFLCSTFISYVLINTIPRIKNWFEKNNINYRFVTVSDIAQIPGVTRLFYSNWSNYLLAANSFVKIYDEFDEYLFDSYEIAE